MKKILCMTAFLLLSVVYGQEIGEKAYKEVRAGGSEVSRWLCCTGITEFDAKENIIHSKYVNSGEQWYKYNDKGNKIYEKDSDGKECLYEYDENGHYIYDKYLSNGDLDEIFYEYTYHKNGTVKKRVEWKPF